MSSSTEPGCSSSSTSAMIRGASSVPVLLVHGERVHNASTACRFRRDVTESSRQTGSWVDPVAEAATPEDELPTLAAGPERVTSLPRWGSSRNGVLTRPRQTRSLGSRLSRSPAAPPRRSRHVRSAAPRPRQDAKVRRGEHDRAENLGQSAPTSRASRACRSMPLVAQDHRHTAGPVRASSVRCLERVDGRQPLALRSCSFEDLVDRPFVGEGETFSYPALAHAAILPRVPARGDCQAASGARCSSVMTAVSRARRWFGIRSPRDNVMVLPLLLSS